MYRYLLLLIPSIAIALSGSPSGTGPLVQNGKVVVNGAFSVPITNYVTDCTGATDQTTNAQTAMTAAGMGTLFIPKGCIIRLATPGAGNASLTIPSGQHIQCEDNSAGFAAARHYCSGGTYPGSQCTSSTTCLGGGTCVYDTGSSEYAPTGGSIYTMLKDSGGTSEAIEINNCSFWTYQADQYQRCVGGTNAGDPCFQMCQAGSTLPGLRCESNANCISGTCGGLADCATPGGTCNGIPLSPSGAGKINPIDLSNTFNAQLSYVTVFDHFVGDFAVKTSSYARILECNFAQEINYCENTTMSAGNRGTACYGAGSNGLATQVVNTQPTVSVTNDVNVGDYSQVDHTYARGSTAAFLIGNQARADEDSVWPPAVNGGVSGPGSTLTGIGYSIGANSQVAKSAVTALGNGSTGISLTGANGTAIRNTILGITGSTGVGIKANSNFAYITGNYVDTCNYGVQIDSGANDTVVNNGLVSAKLASIWNKSSSATGSEFSGNTSAPGTRLFSTSDAPIHYLADNGATQNRVTNNMFLGGWRGISTGSSANGLTNTLITANRFFGLAGAGIAAGGAGVNVDGNYFNFSYTGMIQSMGCDTSCSNRGALCAQDSDCTSCSGSVKNCLPEPVIGFVGSPTAISGSAHTTYKNNLMFMGIPAATKQCTGTTTFVGSMCTVSSGVGACASSATCSGGPPATCASGADVGKYCCPGASPTCAVRTPTPWIRFVDHNQGSGTTVHSTFTFSNNTVFGGTTDNTGLDMVSSASLGGMLISNAFISSNLFESPSSTNTIAINLPTTGVSNISGLEITNNSFRAKNGGGQWATKVNNYQGSMGTMNLITGDIFTGASTGFVAGLTSEYIPFGATIAVTATQATAQTFTAPANMTIWKMQCNMTTTVSGTGTPTRSVFLQVNSSDTAMTCVMGSGVSNCATAAGSASAPVTATKGQPINYREVGGGTTVTNTGTLACEAYASYEDGFM